MPRIGTDVEVQVIHRECHKCNGTGLEEYGNNWTDYDGTKHYEKMGHRRCYVCNGQGVYHEIKKGES